MRSSALVVVAAGAAALGCSGQDRSPGGPPSGSTPHALFVAHEGFLVSYDIATGRERAGTVPNVSGPVDMQAFADGHVMVNLTGRNEILIVDAATMLEKARFPSSMRGGVRPVHSYVSPEIDGKTYWLTLNDGTGDPATNTALFVDCKRGSPTYHKPVGEVGLGIGHHKAAFSTTRARVVISNITDCDDVLTVYDYSDVGNIRALATLTAKDIGWDGSTRAKTCDPTYRMGQPVSPHGCATSKMSRKAYCNLTGSGDIAVVDLDADRPTFKLIGTGGSGGGYTRASRDGRFIYSLQSVPREGHPSKPGGACQVGQLVVIDATADMVVREVPLLYKGPACTESISRTPAETNEPGHMIASPDDRTLFVAIGGGFMVAEARSNQQLVVDVSDPRSAVLKAAIEVGQGTSHRADALSGDGKHLFVTNNVDGTVTHIDVGSAKVVKTIRTKDRPLTLATWGKAEGPSEQTGPVH